MSGADFVAPRWKPISGSGQTLSLTTATAAKFANALGPATYAFVIRMRYAATPWTGYVRVSAGGTAAAAETDYPICSNDPPQVIGCSPNDEVSVYQASGSTQNADLCELTR